MAEPEITYELDETEPPDESGYVAYKWERRFHHYFIYSYGTMTEACAQAHVTEDMVRDRAAEEPVFALRLNYNKNLLKDMINKEMFRRAVEPNEVPIYQRGVLVGKRLEWDTAHLRFVAERLMPELWHLPTKIESGNGDGSIDFHLELSPPKEEDEE